jgi:hypothetical protein
MEEYEVIIAAILNDPQAEVFIYSWGDIAYPTVAPNTVEVAG